LSAQFHWASNIFGQIIDRFFEKKSAVVVAWLAFTGMIFVVSAGMFGAYALGFYDGVKDGERIGGDPSASRRS